MTAVGGCCASTGLLWIRFRLRLRGSNGRLRVRVAARFARFRQRQRAAQAAARQQQPRAESQRDPSPTPLPRGQKQEMSSSSSDLENVQQFEHDASRRRRRSPSPDFDHREHQVEAVVESDKPYVPVVPQPTGNGEKVAENLVPSDAESRSELEDSRYHDIEDDPYVSPASDVELLYGLSPNVRRPVSPNTAARLAREFAAERERCNNLLDDSIFNNDSSFEINHQPSFLDEQQLSFEEDDYTGAHSVAAPQRPLTGEAAFGARFSLRQDHERVNQKFFIKISFVK